MRGWSPLLLPAQNHAMPPPSSPSRPCSIERQWHVFLLGSGIAAKDPDPNMLHEWMGASQRSLACRGAGGEASGTAVPKIKCPLHAELGAAALRAGTKGGAKNAEQKGNKNAWGTPGQKTLVGRDYNKPAKGARGRLPVCLVSSDHHT